MFTKVSVAQVDAAYLPIPPFHPDENYPEYPFTAIADKPNPAYRGVRESLRLLETDSDHFGTVAWNPLGFCIKPGQHVVIKPNFVLSSHAKGGDVFSIITHPSVLRAVLDYVYIALKGTGRIVIADAPQMDCNPQELAELTRLTEIQSFYRQEHNFAVYVHDLRSFWLDVRKGDTAAYSDRRHSLPGDPLGSVVVSLNGKSAFHGKANWQAFYGADYDRNETKRYHNENTHDYVISKTILDADVFISVPKLKVHKKVGATLNSKGLVGITTNKNCLIHYTLGTPKDGGDQFPASTLSAKDRFLVGAQRFLFDALLAKKNPFLDKVYHAIAKLYKRFIQPTRFSMSREKRVLDAGNWHGNDSAWRMTVDLMRIIHFADKDGNLQDKPQRKTFSFLDGIIGGENDGPLAPDAVASGLIVAGENLTAVDLAGVRLMGLDWTKLKWMEYLLKSGSYNLDSPDEITIKSKEPDIAAMFRSRNTLFGFKPHPGWLGMLELK